MRFHSAFIVAGMLFIGAASAAACSQTVTPPPSAGRLPCDVERVLSTRCVPCHASTPQLPVRAPFPLESYVDTQGTTNLLGTKNQPIWRAMDHVIRAGSMPLSTDPPYSTPNPLDADAAKILLDWTGAGGMPVPEETQCP